jgi:tRNA-dihydrouridine synthase 3
MSSDGNATMPGEPLPLAGTHFNGVQSGNSESNGTAEQLSDKKRVRTGSQDAEVIESPVKRQKGVAPIKAE